MLPYVELETAPNPSAAVIWLHGLGADGNDFVPIIPELRDSIYFPQRTQYCRHCERGLCYACMV